MNLATDLNNRRYSIKEVAVKSGMSEAWWRKKIQNNEITVFRVGRRIFIPQSVLEGIFTVIQAKQ